MSTRKIDCQQQTHVSLDDYLIELPDHSSENSHCLQPWNNGTVCLQSSSPALEARSQLMNMGSPASLFYATERYYSGFPQHVDHQLGTLPSFPQLPKNSNPNDSSYRPCDDYFSLNSSRGDDLDLQSPNTLQPFVRFPSENSYRNQRKNILVEDNATLNTRHPFVPFEGIQNPRVDCNQFKLPVSHPSFHLHLEKQSPHPSLGSASITSGGCVSSKMRIRWTQHLHERFVECVNRLGGAERATPKGILKLMDSDGLTIFHIKSHLQKYRIAKYIPDSAEGKSDRRSVTNDATKLDPKTGMQIMEALRLQLDVQRRLHEQLEIQRNLQMRIEEQGKQLKKMFNQQHGTNKDLIEIQNLDFLFPDEQPNNCLEDVEVSCFGEGLETTHFSGHKI